MKINSKKHILLGLLIIGTLGSFLGFGQKVSAAEITASATASSTLGNAAASFLCSKVDSSTTDLYQLLSDSELKYNEGVSARADLLATNRAENDKALASARFDADASYKDQYKKLLAGATTPAQKKAVLTFQKTVTAAILTRRNAVDLAIKAYREGVDQLIENHTSVYLNALSTFKTSIATSFSVVKTNCKEAPTAFILKDSISANLKDARSQFTAKVETLSDESVVYDALADARAKSIDTAEKQFTTTIQKATLTLKVAFGE